MTSYAIRDRRIQARNLRTPKWLTKEEKRQIRDLYKYAAYLTKVTKIRFSVDHIIPLRGKLVSGLHVFSNLQILPEHVNNRKQNTYHA